MHRRVRPNAMLNGQPPYPFDDHDRFGFQQANINFQPNFIHRRNANHQGSNNLHRQRRGMYAAQPGVPRFQAPQGNNRSYHRPQPNVPEIPASLRSFRSDYLFHEHLPYENYPIWQACNEIRYLRHFDAEFFDPLSNGGPNFAWAVSFKATFSFFIFNSQSVANKRLFF